MMFTVSETPLCTLTVVDISGSAVMCTVGGTPLCTLTVDNISDSTVTCTVGGHYCVH